jgi:sortase (surface protein transpeptidase)
MSLPAIISAGSKIIGLVLQGYGMYKQEKESKTSQKAMAEEAARLEEKADINARRQELKADKALAEQKAINERTRRLEEMRAKTASTLSNIDRNQVYRSNVARIFSNPQPTATQKIGQAIGGR